MAATSINNPKFNIKQFKNNNVRARSSTDLVERQFFHECAAEAVVVTVVLPHYVIMLMNYNTPKWVSGSQLIRAGCASKTHRKHRCFNHQHLCVVWIWSGTVTKAWFHSLRLVLPISPETVLIVLMTCKPFSHMAHSRTVSPVIASLQFHTVF